MKTKLVLFGITGDLSRRKLLPALDHIMAKNQEEISIIGVSRREVEVEALLNEAKVNPGLAHSISIVTMDLASAPDYERLKHDIDLQDDEQALIYLSVPPASSASIVEYLGQAGLNTSNVKLLFEKPFGFDLASAHDFLERTAHYFKEEQIYRIDHYAAKDLAQELIFLKSSAGPEASSWSKETIESVEVVAYESIGIEGRGTFYEETGALRDFIQGHLLQWLSLVVAPRFQDESVAEVRLSSLLALHVAPELPTVRAQYKGYREEVNDSSSMVETFASLELRSHDARWEGVSFFLRTGKNLDRKQSAVILHFKDGTTTEYEEGVSVFHGAHLDAYERVLIEAIEGRKAIFTTAQEIIQAWTIVDPVQQAWRENHPPLKEYEPGADPQTILG